MSLAKIATSATQKHLQTSTAVDASVVSGLRCKQVQLTTYDFALMVRCMTVVNTLLQAWQISLVSRQSALCQLTNQSTVSVSGLHCELLTRTPLCITTAPGGQIAQSLYQQMLLLQVQHTITIPA